MVYVPNKSLRRALAILEGLNSAAEGLTATEVAKLTGIPSATTHRLLKELTGLGYLRWDKRSQTYCVGFALTLFGNKRLVIERIVQRARPVLRSLSHQSRLSAYLASLEGTQVIIEDRAFFDQPTKRSYDVGRHLDGHAHSLGKALLSLLPAREIVAALNVAPLQSHTRNTIRRSEDLLEELKNVAFKGYAIDNEEMTVGISSIATPLVNPKGRAMCAIALEGPKHKFKSGNQETFARMLKRASRSIMEDFSEPTASN
jgi:IclR family acetate operon transcriptional repressor